MKPAPRGRRRKPRPKPPDVDVPHQARLLRPKPFDRAAHALHSVRYYEERLQGASTAFEANWAREGAEAWRGILKEAMAAATG